LLLGADLGFLQRAGRGLRNCLRVLQGVPALVWAAVVWAEPVRLADAAAVAATARTIMSFFTVHSFAASGNASGGDRASPIGVDGSAAETPGDLDVWLVGSDREAAVCEFGGGQHDPGSVAGGRATR
jgi:hypothetical protein